ncbi:MAG: phosphatidate cytidylyltransferase [Lentisphaerae bacterium]|nr:phosphatidate cytidylyltransferase [Lentisphaerota bacterium]
MLKHRLMSGTILALAPALAGIFLPAIYIWVLLLVVSGLAQLEFYALLNRGGIPVFRVLGLISGSAMISATFFASCTSIGQVATRYTWENAVLLLTLSAVFVRQFPQKNNPKPLETLGCTLLGVLYVPYFLNYFTRLAFAWEGHSLWSPLSTTGRLLIFYFVVVTKSADIGAYFVGMRFGRHKLFPRISPGKTWEGLAGGIATSIFASFMFYHFTRGHIGAVSLHPLDVVILGALLSVVGVIGDLFESLIKRSTGAKDSSASIPGMGGLLDVLDSLLFGAPVMYLYARVFL